MKLKTLLVVIIAAFMLFWLITNVIQGVKVRRAFIALPPAQQDKVAIELTAAMFNASQTNWTMIVLPRGKTNE